MAAPAGRRADARRDHAEEHSEDRTDRRRQDRDRAQAGSPGRCALRQGRSDQVHRGRLRRQGCRQHRSRPGGRRGQAGARVADQAQAHAMADALAAAPDTPVADADNPPTKSDEWEDAVVSRSLAELREKLAVRRRGPGRAPRKVPTTIRFDADVLEALKATGRGWQTRVNEAMREWVKKH